MPALKGLIKSVTEWIFSSPSILFLFIPSADSAMHSESLLLISILGSEN